jgi:uncharacterized protein (TIGR03067 family)
MWNSFALIAMVIQAEPTDAEAIKKDLEKLQGRWILVRLIEKGKLSNLKNNDFTGLTLSVSNKKLVWKEESETIEFDIQIDPSAKPATINFTWPKSPNSATNYAIYQFVENELWIALGTWPKPNEVTDRPPNFVYQDSDGPRAKFVFVFKREKK